MTFIGWVDCTSMRILVSEEDGYFLCLKYVGSQKIVGAERRCNTKMELSEFLRALPNSDETGECKLNSVR